MAVRGWMLGFFPAARKVIKVSLTAPVAAFFLSTRSQSAEMRMFHLAEPLMRTSFVPPLTGIVPGVMIWTLIWLPVWVTLRVWTSVPP